jgi:hypothetical protein
MKTASILALVIVLSITSEAGAAFVFDGTDCSIRIGKQRIGLADYYTSDGRSFTNLYVGPLGAREVPFTATQGLIGFCCILATLIIVPVVLTVRWKKKRPLVR